MPPNPNRRAPINHRRNPVQLLEALIAETKRTRNIEDDAVACKALSAGLRRKETQPWAEKLVAKFKVSSAYVSQHLIHLDSWHPELQQAVRDGLPLATARKVATLVRNSGEAALIHAALEPFREPSALSNAKRARAVERIVMRLEGHQGLTTDADGWVMPSDHPESINPPEHQAWIFPSLERSGVEREALHPAVARNIIALYSSRDARVIDPFAGTGVIADAAHALGRWSYSSDNDVRGSKFIQQLDVEQLEGSFKNLTLGVDLAVLHPPTINRWSEQGSQSSKDYGAWLEYVIGLVAGLLSKRGQVAVIVPPNIVGNVSAAATVIKALSESPLKLKAMHLAISENGREQWLVFVGAIELVDTADEKRLIAQKKRLQREYRERARR